LPVLFRILRFRKRTILALAMAALTVFLGFRAASARWEERAIPALSWALANKLIVIDPGHGGEDPGALGSTDVHEKDIVLEVSKRLAEILRQAGAEVLLTREGDRDLSDPSLPSLYKAKVQDLTRRVEMANNRRADLFISIHVNSFPDRRENGPQTFSQPGSEEGKKLADAIQKELNKFLENPGREAKQVDYFANRMARMPSVIVEIGFISNPQEEKLMLDPLYQKKIAWTIYAGITRYLAQSKAAKTP
jgi:N-acetylmuramoyl-L-alanine amidase